MKNQRRKKNIFELSKILSLRGHCSSIFLFCLLSVCVLSMCTFFFLLHSLDLGGDGGGR